MSVNQKTKLNKIDLMHSYWSSQKTSYEIAEELNLPEWYIQKEIRRHGLQKSKNGITRKGRKGFEMSQAQKDKRKNQPHAKKVVQICPKTFEIIKAFNSQGAVERCGYNRENVRRAVKTGGLHKGYLWAFEGLEQPTITVVKRKGNLEKKLQACEYKKPTKIQLEKLYITQNFTAEKCAEIFKCHKGTIATLAMNYGLSKTKKPLTHEILNDLKINEGLSVQEISIMYNRTESTIRTYLSRYKIKAMKK